MGRGARATQDCIMGIVEESFHKALNEMNRGNPLEAERLFKTVLKAQPDNFAAFNLLTVVLMSVGRYAEAEKFISKAVELNQSSDVSYYNYGLILKNLNKPQQSLIQFNNALRLNALVPETWNNRGTIFNDLGQYENAIQDFDRAVSLAPNYPAAFCNKGKSLSKLRRYDGAFASYDKALALMPDFAEAWLGRGNVFVDLKRYDEAFASYDRVLTLKPDFAEAWLGRGNVFVDLKRYDEAIASYDKALALKSDFAEAWLGRGNVYVDLKRYDEAIASYDKALALKSDLAEAWLGRGNVFVILKRYDEALASYDKALAINPEQENARLGRGNIFYEYNSIDKALAEYQKALEVRSDFFVARVACCLAELQTIYADEKDIISRRASYRKKLIALRDEIKAGSTSGDCKDLFKSKLPFYLAYQGYNDRDLQHIYGSMACHIMGSTSSGEPLTQLAELNEKIRIGIVSAFFYNHSNWKIPIKGWLSQLDRNRFETFGYHVGKDRDSETEKAATMCDRFVQRIMTINDWRKEILTDAPHVLIYPGLFMDEVSLQLAAQRLAPVQCNSWGHPDTSGMDTVDYFLSSDLMEPPDAAEHYTEKLVRMPNLSIYYEPSDAEPSPISRAELGLRQDAVVFWCGQSLYKYLPQYDEVFARISESVQNCQFVFIRFNGAEQITQIFKDRLDRAFASRNRKASDYYVFLPSLSQNKFVSAIGCCDLFLDSLGWSGCNSTLESLPHNLPIITMQAPLMRGRHSAAILRMIDIEETIAESVDEFVSAAIRLANQPDERKSISQKIARNKSRLYRDRSCIESLEAFLVQVGRKQQS